ncbi:cysteine desulfurase family protein [Blattabacterium cuenoti]|uniref:cysteine desulfurase family protein n=1 Tax=Blattabacterium cuenoti TaxID=1653831 RepID=UPI00163C3E9B|nr:aminotransferase class V-fold PLP-dependent enzyme [Blattabacterium cuenoti]
MKKVYLDNASSTPIRNEVIKVMIDTLKYTFGNPSSLQHSYGRKARSLIEESRISIANTINSDPSEIIFTSGGTEANELVFKFSIQYLNIKHILTSKIEHFSVLNSISNFSKLYNIPVSFIQFDKNGIIDLNHMNFLMKKFHSCSGKILVSLMYVNNEIGNILNTKSVIELCNKYNSYFHSDTIQFIGNFLVNMKKLQVDFITASAHKFYGPKGIGFVVIKKNILNKIKFSVSINNQEHGIRLGTENISGIVGASKALQLSYNNFVDHIKKIKELKYYCILQLEKLIPSLIFNGLSKDFNRSSHAILNFLYPISKIDYLLYFKLDLMGISVSKGSSCKSSKKKISHVIQHITDKVFLKKMMPIRISFGIFNEKKDIDLLIESLKKIRKFFNKK